MNVLRYMRQRRINSEVNLKSPLPIAKSFVDNAICGLQLGARTKISVD
jgi:hypothetical protein